jgi:imidazole glycerol-phosphate synthase subunit HisH
MKQPAIVIVDYGVGNTHSVWNSIRALDYTRLKISNNDRDISDADVLILPGVGAFKACIDNLRRHNLDQILNEAVLGNHKPILGICVGMQLMADISEENGTHTGLGWIPGRVLRLNAHPSYVVPHVGWNNLNINSKAPLFATHNQSPHFYFDHSYYYQCDPKFLVATCDYGFQVPAAISYDHIFGVQFHPEKSDTNGLRLFRNFFNSIDAC